MHISVNDADLYAIECKKNLTYIESQLTDFPGTQNQQDYFLSNHANEDIWIDIRRSFSFQAPIIIMSY